MKVSHSVEVLKCPNCGTPISPDAGDVCECCRHVLAGVRRSARRRGVDDWQGRPEDVGRLRVMAAGMRYVVLGRLGVGDGCDVFFARRDAELTELVVLKVPRARSDGKLLAREWETLTALHGRDTLGAEVFLRRLPQLVAHGKLFGPNIAPRPVSVFRYQSGYVHTLHDVLREYPNGVDPRHVVWLWKRVLEILGWVHRCGYVHGAVLPAHLLVHARDHGVLLVGWSAAVALNGDSKQALSVLSERGREYYPADVWEGAPVTPATDIVMSARCMVQVLGGDIVQGIVPASVPSELRSLLNRWMDPAAARTTDVDAWALRKELDQVAAEIYGPRKYCQLPMPGWHARYE